VHGTAFDHHYRSVGKSIGSCTGVVLGAVQLSLKPLLALLHGLGDSAAVGAHTE